MPPRRWDPPVVIKGDAQPRGGPLSSRGFRRHATAALYGAAAIFAGGAAFDLVVLWILQRNPDNPTWEFFAVATTVEGLPRLVLGVAFAVLALHLAGSTFLLAYRFLGILLIALGLAGLGLAALALLGLFTLRGVVPADQQSALLNVAFKTVILGVLEGAALIPAGRMCMRRPG